MSIQLVDNFTLSDHCLAPLFAPESVALVGASRRRNSVGNDMVLNLVTSKYAGAVFPVNPSYQSLYGYKCFGNLSELPQSVDLTVLSVPNRVLEAVVREAIACKTRALVIFASAELDDEVDDKLRDRVLRIACAAGVPICGANCMGFINPVNTLRAFSAHYPHDIAAGGITLISQSGSLLQALVSSDQRLKFNLAVSTGQELNVDAAQIIDYALDQPSTRVIALILESVRDPDKFVAALEKAHIRKIPIIVLKLGRTEIGAQLALSHTGAIAGNVEVYEAVFRHHGVLCVQDLSELVATALIMSMQKKPLAGKLSAILDSGGERELLVDIADDIGVPFSQINEATIKTLRDNLDVGLEPINPLDAWGTGKDFEAVFETCLSALMDDPDTAMGMLIADLSDDLDLHAAYAEICRNVAKNIDKPLCVMTNYSAWSHKKLATLLIQVGIPVLDGITPSLRAVKHAFAYRDFLVREKVACVEHVENQRASHWRAFLAHKTGPLDEAEGYALLSDYGIDVPPHGIAETRIQAFEIAHHIGFPLVIKTAAPGVLHKSDVGGVKVGLANRHDLEEAYDDIAARLGSRVLICGMAKGVAELAVGLFKDEMFGSFLMTAFGGVWIEIFKDSLLTPVPVDQASAYWTMDNLKMSRVLNGVRGGPPCDKEALAKLMMNLSNLAIDLADSIAEMDINPILVGAEGVVALDCLVVPISNNITEIKNAV